MHPTSSTPAPTTHADPKIDHAHTGVIIVDHGSRRPESNEMLLKVVELFSLSAEGKTYAIIEPAHMELAEPSIATAFDRCVSRGARRVVVMPYFLLPGRHWNQDIPQLTSAAALRHPGVEFLVAAPLGLHPLIGQVLASRLAHCVSHAAGNAGECDVCAGTGRCVMRAHSPAN